MVAEVQKIHQQLLNELEELDKNHQPDIMHPDPRVDQISFILDELKNRISVFRFVSEEEEIFFFKKVLPPLLSLHIYYSEKAAFEINELIGTQKSKTQYYERLSIRIEDFSTAHMEFYEYCCSRKTHLDHSYFLRASPLAREPMYLLGAIADPNCFPAYSIKIASVAAYRKLEQEISYIYPESKPGNVIMVNSKVELRWTGTLADITELGYSFKEAGCINNGQASVKEIMQALGTIFHVNPGHYTRTLQELKIRKKDPTVFLNKLVVGLKRRLDDV